MNRHMVAVFGILSLLAGIGQAQNWSLTNGPSGNDVHQMVLDRNRNVFVMSNVCVRSTDHGTTWSQVVVPGSHSEIMDMCLEPDGSLLAIAAYSANQYWTDSGVVMRSTDDGATWSRLFSAPALYKLAVGLDSTIYVGSYTTDSYPQVFYTYVSHDRGISWDSSFVASQDAIYDICADSNGVAIIATNVGAYRSTNKGRSWAKCVNGIGDGYFRTAGCARGGKVFVSEGWPYRSYVSEDDGRTWKSWGGAGVVAFSVSGRMLSDNGSLQYSDDSGKTWRGFSLSSFTPTASCGAPDDVDGFYCAINNQVFRTVGHTMQDSAPVSVPVGHVLSIASNPDGSLIASSVGYDYKRYWGQSVPSTIWRSTNNGASWSLVRDTLVVRDSARVFDRLNNRFTTTYFNRVVDRGAVTLNPWCFAVDSGHTLFTGGQSGTISRSTDRGLSWSTVPGSLKASPSAIVVAPNGNMYVGTPSDGVFRTTDAGTTWDQLNDGLHTRSVYSLAVSSSNELYAGVDSFVYKSSDNGLTWSQLSLRSSGSTAKALVVSLQGHVIAGMSGDGMYQSTDAGTTWSMLGSGLPTKTINCLLVTPSGIVFAGTDSGVFQLPVGGTTWQPYNLGLTTKNVLSLTRNPSGQLFAGTDGCGVFASNQTFNKVESSVKQTIGIAGLTAGVFPNPSNGAFTVKITNDLARSLRFECLDATGAVVARVPNASYGIGESSVHFDLDAVASGTYSVRIVSSDGSIVVPVVVTR